MRPAPGTTRRRSLEASAHGHCPLLHSAPRCWSEHVHRRRVEHDAARLVRLGVLLADYLTGVRDGPRDGEGRHLDVDVAPPQAAQLAPASPCRSGDEDEAARSGWAWRMPLAVWRSSAGVGGWISRALGVSGEVRSMGLRSTHPHFIAWLKAADRMAWLLRMVSGDRPVFARSV